jgi:FMN reductase
MRRFSAEEVWEDISMKEYDVLYTLSKCPEPIRPTDLNRHVLLSQPALSRLVDRLAARGLVQRVADSRDLRTVRLSLTDDGRALQRRVGRRHARSVARAMRSELTPAELDQLTAICAKLTSHPGPLGSKKMSNPPQDSPLNLVVVSAGTSDPSSTRLLADRTAQRVAALAEVRGATVTTRVIDLRELATDVTTALTSQLITPRLQQAIDALGAADGIIAAAPVYKAGPSGIFTSFFHALDNDLLIGKPVILAATAGTARHALVVDDQMRSLFAYLRTLPVPTSLFAAPEDWSDDSLNKRIDRAAFELVLLMESGFARKVRDESWQSYQHELGSAGGTELGINIDSDLMRLATGGSAS